MAESLGLILKARSEGNLDKLAKSAAESIANLAKESEQATAAAKDWDAALKKQGVSMDQWSKSMGTNLGGAFASSTSKAGQFADAIGRTSTTLARSADAFGLPVGALRSLDDVMDVAELGFNNLSKSAAGFNTASLGVAGAGLAVGTAIGTWLRTFPAVANAADGLAASLYKLVTAQGAVKEGFSPTEAAAIAASQARIKAQVAAQQKAGLSSGRIKDLLQEAQNTKLLADASELLKQRVTDLSVAKKVLAIQSDITSKKEDEAAKKAKEAAEALKAHEEAIKAYIAALPGGKDEAQKIDDIGEAFRRVGAAIPDAALAKMLADLEQLGTRGRAAASAITASLGAAGESIPVSQRVFGLQNLNGEIERQAKLTQDAAIAAGHWSLTWDAALGGYVLRAKEAGEKTEEVAEKTFDWATALQGVALLAGALGGKFGEVLQVVQNIGDAFKDWDTKDLVGKIGAIAGGVGQIGGVVGGRAGRGIQGAAGGAMTGAAIGSVIPGVGTAVGAVVGGIAGLFGGLFGNAEEEAAELQRQKDEAIQAFSDMFEDWKHAREELAATGAEGLNSLIDSLFNEDGEFVSGLTSAANAAEYVAATFNMLRASGRSVTQALEMLGPALRQMRENPDAFRGTSAESLVNLLAFAEANAATLDFIDGLGVTANALAGFGMLTQDLATRIGLDMGGAIQSLIDAGLDYNSALGLNAQALYNLQQAAEQSGVELDAHTQKLIDDAENLGLFDGLVDPMDALIAATQGVVAALGVMIELMGGEVPAALREMIDAFNRANVPTPPPGGGDTGDEGDDGTAGGVDRPGPRTGDGYAEGGPVRRTGLALVHAGEYVLPKDITDRWMGAGAAARGGDTFGDIKDITDRSMGAIAAARGGDTFGDIIVNSPNADPRRVAQEVARAIERRRSSRLTSAVRR